FAIASLSATTSAAEGMATAITIPMMFLGGVFFPIDQLPAWLYSIVKFLPLSPLLKILRQVGLENTSLFTDPVNIIVILAWVCVMLVLSLWRFRLSDG
ncbi:MAG: ABC transporter permease, partial [Patescibacteria group bacterium]